MKTSVTAITRWVFMAIVLLLSTAQPVFADLLPQTDGPVIESLPERPLYGPLAAPLAAPYYSGLAPIAVDDGGAGFTTDEDTPFTLGNVLANDSDPEGDPLTVLSYDASSMLGLLTWSPPTPAGSLDTSFSSDGFLTTAFGIGNDVAYAVALQADGKIVVAGYASNGSNRDFALARYNPDGSLDTTFSGEGLLTTDFGSGSDDYARAVAVQADGKIVVVGVTDNVGSHDFALARYNPDGSLDTTFSGDGLLTTDFGSGNDYAAAIALQADGKIVAAGSAYNGSNDDFALARYNPDGSLDTTFSGDGLLTTTFSSDNDVAHAVALQVDGKIVAAGYAYNFGDDFALARYNPDGSLDTTFSDDGLLTTSFGSTDYAYAVALQADGKIVATGHASNGSNRDFALARYNPDGSLDTTFSSDGLLTTDFGSGYDAAHAVAVQADGKIVATGYASNGSNRDFALARYNPDGSLDTTFSGDGLLTTAFSSSFDIAYAVALQADGKIVAAGYASNGSNTNFALARYTLVDSGSFTYNPNGQFEGLANGETAVETFSYVVSDGTLTDTATVTLTINGLNDTPVLAAIGNQRGYLLTTISFTAAASNPEPSEILTFSLDAGAPVGAVIDPVTGAFSWTPTEAQGPGTYPVTVRVTDNGSPTLDDSETITITVKEVNTAPTAVDDSGAGFTTDNDTPFTLGDVLANDSDPESDPLTVLSYDASDLLGLLTWTPTAGSLDTSFSGDGLLTTCFSRFQDYAQSVAVQTDGKIVAAGVAYNVGFDFALARYNLDGSLDTTFSGDGLLTTDFSNGYDEAYAMAVQADGKIVAAGYASNGSNDDFALARYNPDGSLDTTFSGDGLLTTDFDNSEDRAHAMAVQADGKIVAAGYAHNGSNNDFALARYNPDGSLDTTFSGDGLLTIDFGSDNEEAYAVALQVDGKIVVAGTAYASYDSHNDFALARYNPDGNLDTTFSNDGMLTTDFESSDVAYAVALQPDGKILAAGYGGNSDFALARYNTDGSLDTTFSDDGLLTTAFGSDGDFAYAVALQADGKIVTAGSSYTSSYTGSNLDFALARYNPDGSLDTTFNGDGLLTTDFGRKDYDYARAVALQADGEIVVAGETLDGSSIDFALARYTLVDSGSFTYNPNGQFEWLANGETAVETFSYVVSDGDLTDSATVTLTINGLNNAPTAVDDGGAGFTTDEDTPFTLGNVLANDSDPENDPLTVLSYDASSMLGLLTWNPIPAGILDITFSGDGLLTTAVGSGDDYADAIALQPDGKIVAAGYADNGSNRDFALARYNLDGSLDTSFSGDGLLTTDFGSGNDYAAAIALQPDGKIVAAGNAYNGSTYDFALARYNPDGSLDTTFSGDGLLTTPIGSNDNYASAVALQADGRIVAAGHAYNGSNYDFALARYNPDGGLDTTFSGDGLLTTPMGSSDDYASGMALQADGKIVVAGCAWNSSDNGNFALARYNPDGSLDTTFSSDGKLTTAFGSGNVGAYAVAVQADGKIMAAGYIWSSSASRDSALVRYNPNGSLDTTFNDDGWLTTAVSSGDDFINAVVLQSDGKILAAGYADNGGNGGFALERYNPDGNLDTTFSDDGLINTAFGFGYDLAYALALQANGKIVVAGYAWNGSDYDFALARYTAIDDSSFTYTPNGQFEGLANGETAVETFSYVVSDGTLTDTATATLTINGLNDAPVLAAIGNQSGYPLTTISFTAAASDPDLSNTLTFSLDAGEPVGAVIDPVTGAFSWTPTEAQGPGTYPVTVRVTDNGSPTLDDSETINITIYNHRIWLPIIIRN